MNGLAPISTGNQDLPSLIDRAASMLAGAKTAAEVLEAREFAGLTYDAAKRAARLSRAKAAHDDLIAAAHRAQAHALEIEAAAKRRLADEYDAAQEQGDVGQQGARTDLVRDANEVVASAADLGLNRREIHDARLIQDAEVAEPGIGTRTLGCRRHVGDHNMPGSQQGQLINLLPKQKKVAGVTELGLIHLKPQNPKGAKADKCTDIVADSNDVSPAAAADQLGFRLEADHRLPLTPAQWAGQTPSHTSSSSPNQEGAL